MVAYIATCAQKGMHGWDTTACDFCTSMTSVPSGGGTTAGWGYIEARAKHSSACMSIILYI